MTYELKIPMLGFEDVKQVELEKSMKHLARLRHLMAKHPLRLYLSILSRFYLIMTLPFPQLMKSSLTLMNHEGIR